VEQPQPLRPGQRGVETVADDHLCAGEGSALRRRPQRIRQDRDLVPSPTSAAKPSLKHPAISPWKTMRMEYCALNDRTR
jgi:hypothetical protein